MKNILVVDDDIHVLTLTERMLKRSGFSTTCFSSVEKLTNQPCEFIYGFDLLITDITMPYMCGVELVDKLLKVKPDLKYLYMSGFSANYDVPEDLVLSKPFMLPDLICKVNFLLDSRV